MHYFISLLTIWVGSSFGHCNGETHYTSQFKTLIFQAEGFLEINIEMSQRSHCSGSKCDENWCLENLRFENAWSDLKPQPFKSLIFNKISFIFLKLRNMNDYISRLKPPQIEKFPFGPSLASHLEAGELDRWSRS